MFGVVVVAVDLVAVIAVADVVTAVLSRTGHLGQMMICMIYSHR